MPSVMRKQPTTIRGGDMTRTMWKQPGKISARCLEGDWSSSPGISMANAGREARRHSRNTGHTTRVAYIEVIEYKPGRSSHVKEQGVTSVGRIA
jgi:hypothetical protein